jgi:hypothetical protein
LDVDAEEALLIGIYVDLDRQRFLLTKQILKLIRSNFIKEYQDDVDSKHACSSAGSTLTPSTGESNGDSCAVEENLEQQQQQQQC